MQQAGKGTRPGSGKEDEEGKLENVTELPRRLLLEGPFLEPHLWLNNGKMRSGFPFYRMSHRV